MSELNQHMDNEQLESEMIQESFSRINAARKAQDQVGFRDRVLEMATYFDQHERFEHAIGILKDALRTELLEESTHALPVIDRLVGLLLKTEDYVALNEVLKLRKSKIPTHGSPYTLQKFYEAVCLEGLGHHHEAITSLNDIEDTLSNTNLASKYLKLTMLHLKTDQYPLAEQMFAKALIFDSSENNPIFKLIRSDLAFARNEFLEAMKHYQDYFIQAKARNRYLDRYIAICTRTGDYEEALRFYHTYKQEVDQQISKQAKIRFYEASLDLLQATEHLTEHDECYRKLASIQKDHHEPLDWPAAYASIAPSALPYNKHRDPRRMVLEMLRKIHHQLINARCEFIFRAEDQYVVLTYCDDHLQQKILTDTEASPTLLPKMLHHQDSDMLMQNEALGDYVDHLNLKPYAQTVFVVMASVTSVTFAHAHLVIISEQNDHIARDRSFLNVSAQWLEAHLDTYVHVHEERERNRYLLDALARTETAIIRIEMGIIHFLTPQAQTLFDVELISMPYEALQARMPDTEKVFIDELHTRPSWSFHLLLRNGATREIHAHIWQDELALMLMCAETSHGESHFPSNQPTSMLESIQPIQDVFRQKTSNHPALVIAHFPGVEEYMSQRAFSLNEAFYHMLQTTITQSAKKHYEAIYIIDPARIAIGLSTTDKRVIERVSSSLIRLCESFPHGLNLDSPRISVITHLNQLSQEALVKRVYQIAYATDSDGDMIESDMKTVTTREALYFTITESFR
ncbi:MAG: tetratricopeptide repeat protein, partial [Candidatus Izemoplasmatales bacterium]|nr:tetratricopeptide repeat protein [Candidatus Izemoplasmatales bacterium]